MRLLIARPQTHGPVVVKDLKTIDVQHADDGVLAVEHRVVVFHLDHTVDATDDPSKKSLVESLRSGNKVKGQGSAFRCYTLRVLFSHPGLQWSSLAKFSNFPPK